ncbi:MAG TPA: class I SAM-dependent methyltransferase [Bryobacterales bacterium]|nr:class I SAM-dependent methyltransferase [Bryobacterales bacterium]
MLLAKYYDYLIDWSARLAREIPFLAELIPGKRVLVAACGTGGHLPALAAAGFEVTGIDSDAEMVEIARSKSACRVEQLALEDCLRLGQNFAAVLCLGNVLPNLPEPGRMETAIAQMHAVLAPGGVCFTQNLNYDRRWREKARFFPLLSGRKGKEEIVLFKFADYGESYIDFHTAFVSRPAADSRWTSTVESSRQRPVFQQDLERACRLAGFRELRAWGSYGGEPFDIERSSDLLLAAWK